MSRHTSPSVEFGKLKLEDSVSSPSQRRGLTGKSLPSSRRRRAAASHQSSPLTGSHSSRAASSSGTRYSAVPSERELRPSTIRQGVNRGGSGSNEEEGEEEEEDDNENNPDNGGHSDDSEDEDRGNRNEEDAILSSSLHIRELLACCTDDNLTSVQLIAPACVPDELSPLTGYLCLLARNLAYQSSNQQFVAALMDDIPRTVLISRNIANFWPQVERIFRELQNNINQQGGHDIDQTVAKIVKWQLAVQRFLGTYQRQGLLTNEQMTRLYYISILTLQAIMFRNRDLYNGRQQPGPLYLGDTHLFQGNLYQNWRRRGQPGILFWVLRSLRNYRRELSEAYRATPVDIRNQLRAWRGGPGGEAADEHGPIISDLMEAAW